MQLKPIVKLRLGNFKNHYFKYESSKENLFMNITPEFSIKM